MSRNLLTVFAVTVLFASSLSALAQTSAGQVSTRVFYGDLDLSKPAGMQTLHARLKAASVRVCADRSSVLRTSRSEPAQCSRDAIANALEAINRSQNRVVADNGQKPEN
jgi:UrcA family protein